MCCIWSSFFACGARLQRGYVPYLGHTCTRICYVDYVHRFQDRVLMDGCSMDAPCISASVIASMYGVPIPSLICMWDAYSTWICTVSWSYMDHQTHSYYNKKSKNSGLPGDVSMYEHCISALVCASTHGLHMVIIFCMWDEAKAWICTVSWSYMHSHVPCELGPQVPGSCAYGWM